MKALAGMSPNARGLGIALMAAAMLMLPIIDGIAKLLSASHSPLFISWARYAAASVIVLPLAVHRFGTDFLPREELGAHLLRTVLLVSAMTSYVLAIRTVPLATAVSAYFVGPIIAMMLAVVLLGERLTTVKLVSVALGFAGALIVVEPTAIDFDPNILFALATGVFLALYLVTTRRMAQRADPVKTLAFQCIVGAVLLTPQALITWSWPAVYQWWMFAAIGVVSVCSHMLSILALRYAEASTLAPLVYLELIGSVAIGYMLFGDVPGPGIWIGAAGIIAAGALLLRR